LSPIAFFYTCPRNPFAPSSQCQDFFLELGVPFIPFPAGPPLPSFLIDNPYFYAGPSVLLTLRRLHSPQPPNTPNFFVRMLNAPTFDPSPHLNFYSASSKATMAGCLPFHQFLSGRCGPFFPYIGVSWIAFFPSPLLRSSPRRSSGAPCSQCVS